MEVAGCSPLCWTGLATRSQQQECAGHEEERRGRGRRGRGEKCGGGEERRIGRRGREGKGRKDGGVEEGKRGKKRGVGMRGGEGRGKAELKNLRSTRAFVPCFCLFIHSYLSSRHPINQS